MSSIPISLPIDPIFSDRKLLDIDMLLCIVTNKVTSDKNIEGKGFNNLVNSLIR